MPTFSFKRVSPLASVNKELAERLGLKAQQIQRYEATHYAGPALRRVQAVADALGLKIREEIELPPRPREELA